MTVKNVSNLAASVQARLQSFVLKGALMLHVWEAPLARATKDLDFLGRLDNSLENLERVVREVCNADVEPDGMVFGPATVRTVHRTGSAPTALLGSSLFLGGLSHRRRLHGARRP